MAETRTRGVRLTREERLTVRRLISDGRSFEEAAAGGRQVFDEDDAEAAEHGGRDATTEADAFEAALVIG